MSRETSNEVVELVVLTDESNASIGVAPKVSVHSANTPLHRAFSCFLFNTQGELLLQQRARTKHTWPGIWSNSACGHPAPEEGDEDAVYRRLEYELGVPRSAISHLAAALPNFRYFVRRDGVVEREFCPVFIGMLSTEPKANLVEVEATQWLPWSVYAELAVSLLPKLSAGIPYNERSFAAYQAQFETLAAYEAAHVLPTGEQVSEWSLWEASLLEANETFKSLQLQWSSR